MKSVVFVWLLSLFFATSCPAQLGPSFPGPGVSGGSTVPTLSFNRASTTGTSTGSVSSVTFTAEPIGTASAVRNVIVSIGVRFVTIPTVVSSVTVGGNACISGAALINNTSGFGSYAGVWMCPVSTGTTANVVVNYSATSNSFIAIATYSAYNVISTTPVTATSTNDTSQNLSLNTLAGGIVIGAIYQVSASNASWSGLTSDYNSQASAGTQILSGASASNVAAASPRSITATLTGTTASNQAGVAAAYR